MKCVLPFEQLPEFSFLRSRSSCGATSHTETRFRGLSTRPSPLRRPTDAVSATTACPPGGMFHLEVLNGQASLGLAGSFRAVLWTQTSNLWRDSPRRSAQAPYVGQGRSGRLARCAHKALLAKLGPRFCFHPQADSKRPAEHQHSCRFRSPPLPCALALGTCPPASVTCMHWRPQPSCSGHLRRPNRHNRSGAL